MSDYSEFIGFMAEKSSAEQRHFYYWERLIADRRNGTAISHFFF